MNLLHDKDLEGKVLGALMSDWNIWHEVSDLFYADLFVNPDYINVAKVIISLRSSGHVCDMVSVDKEMKKRNYLTETFNTYGLSQLTNDISTIANTEKHIRYLQELWMKREVFTLSTKTIQSLHAFNSDIFDVIDNYEKGLTELTDKIITSKISTPPELLKEVIEINKKIVNMKGNLSGVTSGYRIVDEITGGWQPADFIILAADSGIGKTSLGLCFLKNAALKGIPVACFSLEMNERQLFARLLSQETEIELSKILRTGLNDDEVKTLEERTQELKKAPIFIDDSNMNMFELKNKARKLKRKHNIKMLLIDYLQLIKVDHLRNRADAVSYISRELKSLAKELNIPVIAISSVLNKAIAERTGHKPQKSDLRESGNIEFDADLIFLLYRAEHYKIYQDDAGESTKGKAALMLEKHRNGALEYFILGYEGPITKFFTIGVDDPGKKFNQPIVISPNLGFEEEGKIHT